MNSMGMSFMNSMLLSVNIPSSNKGPHVFEVKQCQNKQSRSQEERGVERKKKVENESVCLEIGGVEVV